MNCVFVKAAVAVLFATSLLGFAGCGGKSAGNTKEEAAAFAGNPNSPQAKAAAQAAMADAAKKAAEARATAASAPKPTPK